MATLKRKNANGDWEFVETVGSDVSTLIDSKMPKSGGVFTGKVSIDSSTDPLEKQVRNIILSDQDIDLSAINDGDIWIKYRTASRNFTINNLGSSIMTLPEVTLPGDILTFNAVGSENTGGIIQWVIPRTGIYRIEATGAAGGYGYSTTSQGGKGAVISGDFLLNMGDTLKFMIGQTPSTKTATNCGGGGGGGTFITTIDNIPLIVAGGGGGGGYQTNGFGLNASLTTDGIQGMSSATAQTGGAGGVDGEGGIAGSSYTGGGGGFNTDGTSNSTTGIGGQSFLNGGEGGYHTNTTYVLGGYGGGGSAQHGGGGGGGYSGGGGGSSNWAGGGGGSYNSGDNPINTHSMSSSHGKVVISLLRI